MSDCPATVLVVGATGRVGRLVVEEAGGVSPSQASPEQILRVDLYGTALVLDEAANIAALLMGPEGGFTTGSDFLIDGGVTAAWWYGDLAPE